MPRRPWNVIDCPVYSLATQHNGQVNMNICTYVTAVSMKPKIYSVAIYHNTRTLANMAHTDVAVLQLLSPEQVNLVKHLGFKSGNDTDKHEWLMQKGLTETWQGHTVLKGCAALLLLRRQAQHHFGGDHELFLFGVDKYKNLAETVLTLNDLRAKKLIRI